MPDQRSLLDQIHAACTAAEQNGQHDFAQWLRAHADEPCPAAIAQAMGGPRYCTSCGQSVDCCQDKIRHDNAPCCFECVHPPSDPPAPDASTDAVREAIAEDVKHAKCSRTYCDAGDTHSEECRRSRFVRPLLAALTDARLDSRNAKDKLGVVQTHYRALEGLNCELTQERDRVVEKLRIEREHSEKLTHSITDAGKRAMEAVRERIALGDSLIAQRDEAEGQLLQIGEAVNWTPDEEHDLASRARYIASENAALTRKLATVLPFVEEVTPLIAQHEDDAVLIAYAGCGKRILAAIDVPAAEEAVSPSDWCLAVTCPSCGARCQRKSGHGFGVHHAGACAADCRNALPIKPANAQGSGAGDVVRCTRCHNTRDLHLGEDGVTLFAHPFEPPSAKGESSWPQPPTSPPFTAEEAREEGEQQAVYGRACFTDPIQKRMLRIAATLRRYADMLDRGDALERAAVNALRSFDEFTIERTGGAFVYQVIGGPMEDLRFVLAQRAKENR